MTDLSNGNSFSNGQGMGTGKTTEREAPIIRRLLCPVQDPR
jgi:hypothetical protein